MRAVGRCCWSKPNLLAQTSFILFSLVIAAWTAPLLSTNPAYTPQVGDTVGPSGMSHYQLLGPGRATFAAFGYWDEFAMLNTTTAASGALSVLSTSYYSPGGGESWASTELDMACHYSVYQRVTSFADPWRDGAYRNDAASGTRVTLEAPNCRMLTAHRVSLICLIVALLPFLIALLTTCCCTSRKADMLHFRVVAVERQELENSLALEGNPYAGSTVLPLDPHRPATAAGRGEKTVAHAAGRDRAGRVDAGVGSGGHRDAVAVGAG